MMQYKNISEETLQIPGFGEIKSGQIVELNGNIVDSRLERLDKKEIKSKK